LYDQIQANKVVRHVAYTILVGKLERKGLLGRSRHRWQDNSKMGLKI
jgi:hypothetical protein